MLLEKIYEKNHLCIKFLNIKFKFNLEHLKQLYKKSKNYKNYFHFFGGIILKMHVQSYIM